MGYASGMLKDRVEFFVRKESEGGEFGRGSAGESWESVGKYWAAVDFSRGLKSLREGEMEAYEELMVRMRWTDKVTRDCRMRWQDRWWEIQSWNVNKMDNIIQGTVRELTNGEGWYADN